MTSPNAIYVGDDVEFRHSGQIGKVVAVPYGGISKYLIDYGRLRFELSRDQFVWPLTP
jgi:hypothetical protein